MIIPVNESSWGRLYQHIQEGDAIGIITAFRGNLSLAENRKRNKQLENMIRALHFGFNKIEGHYVEDENGDVAEETFVVYSDEERKEELEKLLDEAMTEFSQDSYIYVADGKAELIFRNGEVMDLGDFRPSPGSLGRIYSKIKHTPFRFGDIVEGCQYQKTSMGQGDAYRYRVARKMLRESNGDFCKKYTSTFRERVHTRRSTV